MTIIRTTLSTIETVDSFDVYDDYPNIAHINMLVHKYNVVRCIMIDLNMLDMPLAFYKATKAYMGPGYTLWQIKRQALYYSGCCLSVELVERGGSHLSIRHGHMYRMRGIRERKLARVLGYKKSMVGLCV